MLTSLRMQNFKAWQDTGHVRLAPLTVIFGANSAGKSSFGHLLLALKQTALSADRKRVLHLGDDNSLIDLGTFEDCLYRHETDRALSFDLRWAIPGGEFVVRDPISHTHYSGDAIELSTVIRAPKIDSQPQVEKVSFELLEANNSELNVCFEQKEKKRSLTTSSNYTLVRNTGRAWPLEEPDKFYRISDQSRARFQNAAFIADFALETEAALGRVYYLGPLRDHPKRIYQWSGDTPESVGQKGEFTIAAVLAAAERKRRIRLASKRNFIPFEVFIAQWLKDLGIIESLRVTPLAQGRKEYEVLLTTYAGASEVKITDVGFGVSQVLPALVQAFYCPPNSTVWMEQPEIHLHPKVQAQLADVFIAATQAQENGKDRNVQLIIESHSEHFLNRLQRRIAEGSLRSVDVEIYFCSRNGDAAALERLIVNQYGEIENWPENFFGDDMADHAARVLAASRQKRGEA